jgi:hypothetical protein
MGGACSTHGKNEKFIQNILREETIQKTKTWMGEYYYNRSWEQKV